MLGSKPTRRYCRYCGSSVTPTDAFCSSCGERLVPREGIARDNRAATVPSRAETRHASFSRFWPASASREIVAGVMVAVSVAVLLVGLIYGLLMLRGAFADPSVPRTLGLVVFALVHGGAFSVSVPPSPSLLGIGGSFLLGLPPTSFALLPFVALLVLGRFVARRTESTLLFACCTAVTYALLVGLLAALGSIRNAEKGCSRYVSGLDHQASEKSSSRKPGFRRTGFSVTIGNQIQTKGPSSSRMSASEIIPTSLSPSTTKRRSSPCSSMSRAASSASWSGPIVTSSRVAMSSTVTEPGSWPSATTLAMTSRSVTMPTGLPSPSTTGKGPFSSWIIFLAASTTLA